MKIFDKILILCSWNNVGEMWKKFSVSCLNTQLLQPTRTVSLKVHKKTAAPILCLGVYVMYHFGAWGHSYAILVNNCAWCIPYKLYCRYKLFIVSLLSLNYNETNLWIPVNLSIHKSDIFQRYLISQVGMFRKWPVSVFFDWSRESILWLSTWLWRKGSSKEHCVGTAETCQVCSETPSVITALSWTTLTN